MPTIHWLDAFEIGHDKIDCEHRELLEQAVALEEILEAGEFDTAKEKCRALRDRLVSHFASEEDVLEASEFPRMDEHIRTHAATIRKSENLLSECCEECESGLKIGCTTRWSVVILDHVMSDLDFKSHLQDRHIVPGRYSPD